MTVLPRFLYMFVTIPIWLPKQFFIKLDKYVSSFIWNRAMPRIKKIYLERPKSEGGLGLPNFLHYYWASNISKLAYWVTSFSDKNGPAWAMMELSSHASISPISLLTAPLATQTNRKTFSNPVVSNSIRIWVQFRKHFNLDQINSLSPFLSIISSHPHRWINVSLAGIDMDWFSLTICLMRAPSFQLKP